MDFNSYIQKTNLCNCLSLTKNPIISVSEKCSNAISELITKTEYNYKDIISQTHKICQNLQDVEDEKIYVQNRIFVQCVNSEKALPIMNLRELNSGLFNGLFVSFAIDSLSHAAEVQLIKKNNKNAAQIANLSNFALRALVFGASAFVANNAKEDNFASFFAASAFATTMLGLTALKVVVPEKTQIINAIGALGSILLLKPAIFLSNRYGYTASACQP